MIKTIPKKKKCKKEKWLSEEALQIAEKGREAKSKGEKERYTHLNAEFQRIARRDMKAFLSDQCKEIEENNRLEKVSFHSNPKERQCQSKPRFPTLQADYLPAEPPGKPKNTGVANYPFSSESSRLRN